MTDLIFAVDDPVAWHEENMRANPTHYSGLGRVLGPASVAAVQDDLAGTLLGHSAPGGRLWYNTRVPVPDVALPRGAALLGARRPLVKYGVTSLHALLDDLLTWRSLYAAGRLHKPVRTLAVAQPGLVLAAARENLRHALRAALLMLPASFTPEQLYVTIAALSYTGA